MRGLGELFWPWREDIGLRSVDFVDEGMRVLAPYRDRQALRCVVVVAAGNHARVVNEKRGYDQWFHIRDLRQSQPPTEVAK